MSWLSERCWVYFLSYLLLYSLSTNQLTAGQSKGTFVWGIDSWKRKAILFGCTLYLIIAILCVPLMLGVVGVFVWDEDEVFVRRFRRGGRRSLRLHSLAHLQLFLPTPTLIPTFWRQRRGVNGLCRRLEEESEVFRLVWPGRMRNYWFRLRCLLFTTLSRNKFRFWIKLILWHIVFTFVRLRVVFGSSDWECDPHTCS